MCGEGAALWAGDTEKVRGALGAAELLQVVTADHGAHTKGDYAKGFAGRDCRLDICVQLFGEIDQAMLGIGGCQAGTVAGMTP